MLEVGDTFERYRVEGHLGTGGMAEVYLVRHVTLGNLRAMKVIADDNPRRTDRFAREGRLQASLRHPHVVPMLDVLRVQGRPALLMAYVDGPTLGEVLRHFRPSVEQLDVLVRDILSGVAAAHDAGIVHRDLKPSNILLACQDGQVVPRIADFGLARILHDPGEDRVRTRSGAAMGTLDYMSPEQIRSAADADTRADVFSLGCILYELVAGAPPFAADDLIARHEAITARRWRPVEERAPSVPMRMERAIRASLEPDPAARPTDAAALLRLWEGGTPRPTRAWEPQHVARVAALRPSVLAPTTPVTATAGPEAPVALDPAVAAVAAAPVADPPVAPRPAWLGAGVVLALLLAAAGVALGVAAMGAGESGAVAVAAPVAAVADPAPSERGGSDGALARPDDGASARPDDGVPERPGAALPARTPPAVVAPAPKPRPVVSAPPAAAPSAPPSSPPPSPPSSPPPVAQPAAAVWTTAPAAPQWRARGVQRATLVDARGRSHAPGTVAAGRYRLQVVFDGETAATEVLQVTLADGDDRTFDCQAVLRSCR